jgi:hypothetical protein
VKVLALAVAALGVATTASPAAISGPSFVFGRTGGNIRPYTVTIASNGKVTATGVQLQIPALTLAPEVLGGLAKLAIAEGVPTLPRTIRCPHTLPDIAGRFVTIRTAGGRKTVTEIGNCTPGFDEFYAVLAAAAAVSS